MSILHVTPDDNRAPDSGIYGILNTMTGKIYVGSTVSLHKRRWGHTRLLRLGRHSNPHLQAAYNKDGAAAFAWGCLELVPAPELIAREAYWIDTLRAADPACGYNLLGAACGRITPTEETRAKISAGTKRGLSSPAVRAKISAAVRARPPISEETRARMSVASSRQPKATPEMRARLSAIHKQRLAEHPVTAEHRAALSVARRARPPHSAETRAKISAASRNQRPITEETRAKLRESGRRCGELRRAREACKRAARATYVQSTFEDLS